MIEEPARVVEVRGGRVWVETQRQSACGQCSVSRGCGTASLDKHFGKRLSRLEVIAGEGCSVGDEVIIGLHGKTLLRASMAVYLLPLVALLGAALLGEVVAGFLHWPTEPSTIFFGLTGLAAGFFWLKGYTARIRHDPDYQAVILRRVGNTVFSVDLSDS